MKKLVIVCLMTLALTLSFAITALAEEQNISWIENQPVIEIIPVEQSPYLMFELYCFDNPMYVVEGLALESATLLMVNGSFVPGLIQVVEDKSLIPVRVVSELLGAKVDWDGGKQVTITNNGIVAQLVFDSKDAYVNDEQVILDVPATVIDDTTYVPAGFVEKILGATVDHISDLKFGTDFDYMNNVDVVVIDKPDEGATTADEAKVLLDEWIPDHYRAFSEYLTKLGEPTINMDENAPGKLTYIGETLGRYYLFSCEGKERFNILFNKYSNYFFSVNAENEYFGIYAQLAFIQNNYLEDGNGND